MFSRRRFFRLVSCGTATCFAVRSTVSAGAEQSAMEHLLCLAPGQAARLEEARRGGLMELAPVSLPPDPGALNNHFGWPVATRTGDTIIVVHRRIPGHWKGLERTNDRHSYTMVVRSTDGGETWTEPFDLRQVMTREDRFRGGHIPLAHRYKFARDQDPTLGYKVHLNAIGTASDGGVVLVSDHGVFRSDDRGRTWMHFSRAMREDTTSGPVVYVGPRLFEHPDYGLVVTGHSNLVTEQHKEGPHPPDTDGKSVRIDDKIHFRYSRDGGRTWAEEEQSLPAFVRPAEPVALLHENRLAIVCRSYDPRLLRRADGHLGLRATLVGERLAPSEVEALRHPRGRQAWTPGYARYRLQSGHGKDRGRGSGAGRERTGPSLSGEDVPEHLEHRPGGLLFWKHSVAFRLCAFRTLRRPGPDRRPPSGSLRPGSRPRSPARLRLHGLSGRSGRRLPADPNPRHGCPEGLPHLTGFA